MPGLTIDPSQYVASAAYVPDWRLMDTSTANALIELNNCFYAQNAASFSATRAAPWAGWRRLSELLAERKWASAAAPSKRIIMDMACGNMRFERYLAAAFPTLNLHFHAIDSCPDLAPDSQEPDFSCTYHHLDVLSILLDAINEQEVGSAPAAAMDALPMCDLSVCFGFMHHVPSPQLRQRLLDVLLDHTVPGGLVVLSFWQFMLDDRLATKARRADGLACAGSLAADFPQIDIAGLEKNDHFLGWQANPAPLRYCHHFDESELDQLVASVGTSAREVARYSADGSSGTLNRYLVLERMA